MEVWLLAAARALPATILAPLPATPMARLALGLIVTAWCAHAQAPRLALNAGTLAIELAIGLVLGFSVMLAAEAARAAGMLVQRPFGAPQLGPLFQAVFWLTFLSGPHVVWLRGMGGAKIPSSFGPDWVTRALPDLMAAVVDTTLPVLVTYGVVHALYHSFELALNAPTGRKTLEPILAAFVVVVSVHAITSDVAVFTKVLVVGVSDAP